MASRSILIDSNLLIYAINSSSPKHRAAQDFLNANLANLVVAHQNLLEALRVLTHTKFPHPLMPGEALGAILAITDNCLMIAPNKVTYHLTIDLIKRYGLTGDKISDAYLASTALSNDIFRIATNNVRDFQSIKEITLINPF